MSAIEQLNLMSVEGYLAGELISAEKHEYLAGVVHAMAGATNVHNRIATNVAGLLHARLRKKPCQPYNSDTKIRVRLPTHVRFYYPDISVVCQPNPPEDSFQDEPVLIVEVVSRSTRRIDDSEKKDAYLTIDSLSVYIMIEQDFAAAVVHRRTDQAFVREVYYGLEAIIPLPEIESALPLEEVYEGVQFLPESLKDENSNAG